MGMMLQIFSWGWLVAVVIGMATSALWYYVLAKPWIKAAGLDEQTLLPLGTPAPDGHKPGGNPLPFVIALLANAGFASFWAIIGAHSIEAIPLPWYAVFTAVLVVFPTIAVNNAFSSRPFALSLIDGGNWFAVLLFGSLAIHYLG